MTPGTIEIIGNETACDKLSLATNQDAWAIPHIEPAVIDGPINRDGANGLFWKNFFWNCVAIMLSYSRYEHISDH